MPKIISTDTPLLIIDSVAPKKGGRPAKVPVNEAVKGIKATQTKRRTVTTVPKQVEDSPLSAPEPKRKSTTKSKTNDPYLEEVAHDAMHFLLAVEQRDDYYFDDDFEWITTLIKRLHHHGTRLQKALGSCAYDES